MDRIMHDVRVYANDVVDRLNALKDKNRVNYAAQKLKR